MAEKKLDIEPEGICQFCKRPIYKNLKEHELICKFSERMSENV
jgi:hypothetical protein